MYRILAWGLVFSYGIFVGWFVNGLGEIEKSIAHSMQEMAKPSPVPVAVVRFSDAKRGLVVPSWKWLEVGGRWAYASPKGKPISADFEPKLEKMTVTAGEWIQDNRADPRTIEPLEKMFEAAKKDGIELLVTSSYRSPKHQAELLQESIAKNGREWADKYMESSGGSEHQLGLAIDMTTYSPSCQINFSNCSISSSTAEWLAKNAPKFGFILRYPPGKEAITGLAYESWHYRYVGKEMAAIIEESGLTFDEVYSKLLEAKK